MSTEDTTAQLREQIAAIRAEHEAHNYRVTALRNPHDCDGCTTDGTAKWDVTWSNEGRDEEPFLCDDCLAREFREIRLCDEIDAALAQVEAAKATARRDALLEAADEVKRIRADGGVGPYARHFEDWLRARASAQGAAAPVERSGWGDPWCVHLHGAGMQCYLCVVRDVTDFPTRDQAAQGAQSSGHEFKLAAGRAAGGVQPAPAEQSLRLQLEKRGAEIVDLNLKISAQQQLMRDQELAIEIARSAAGSTDGAATPEFIYPGGGLAFAELTPATSAGSTPGPRDWTHEPDARELGLCEPTQLGPEDYPEDHGGRDPHCAISHPHSPSSRCAGD